MAPTAYPQQPPPCHAWALSRLPRIKRSCNRFPRQPARGAGASLPAQQPRRLQQPLHSTLAALLALQPELTSRVSLGVAVLDVMGDRGGCRERLCFCEGRGPLIGAMDGCASASGQWGLGDVDPAALAACTATLAFNLTVHSSLIHMDSFCHCWCPHKTGGQAGAGPVLGEAGRRRRAAPASTARPCRGY